MTTSCDRCQAPLSSTDGRCPACGAVPPRSPSPVGGQSRTIFGTGGSGSPGAAPIAAPPGAAASPVVGVRQSRTRRSAAGTADPIATGTITGPIAVGVVTASTKTQRTCARVAGTLTAIALLWLLFMQVDRWMSGWATGRLAGLAAVVVVLLLVAFVITGRRRRRRADRAKKGRAVLGLGRLLKRSVARPVRTGRGGTLEATSECRRFRLTDVSGRVVACELVGVPVGAELNQGDVIDAFGHRTRQDTVRVTGALLGSERTYVTARPNFRFRLARFAWIGMTVVAAGSVCTLLVRLLE
jgi:hypothetical protein